MKAQWLWTQSKSNWSAAKSAFSLLAFSPCPFLLCMCEIEFLSLENVRQEEEHRTVPRERESKDGSRMTYCACWIDIISGKDIDNSRRLQ